MRRLRPALLRRRHGLWHVEAAAYRPPRHTRLQPVRGRRREIRPAPLAATLLLRRARTLVRERIVMRERETRLATRAALPPTILRLLEVVAPPPLPPEIAPPTTGAAPWDGSTSERAPRATPLSRAQLVERETRVRILRHVRTERLDAPAAPRGAVGTPPAQPPTAAAASLPLVLRGTSGTPAAPRASEQLSEAPSLADPHGELLLPPRSALATPAVPDVDQLATQVLDRIERRAIAQRERMGRI